MCQDCEVVRTPVKIKRKAIAVARKNGWHIGGWFAFPKPDEEPPAFSRKLKHNERVLWCPYCDEWSVFKRDGQTSRYLCLGICGWANTDDFHVRTKNQIWFEDVPLSELKKLDIPRPHSKGRR